MTIVVETGARIHMGLIDISRATERAYGGVGFGIEAPATIVWAAAASKMSFKGLEDLPSAHQQKVERLLSNIKVRYPGTFTEFTLKERSPIHSGFGSCTSLLMSIAKAHTAVHGIDALPEDIQRISGRGGTSGIGLNAFFTGGVVRDSGRPWTEIETVGPSSTATPTTLPTVLANPAFPSDWRIALLTPDGQQIAGRMERQFFTSNVPSVAETLEVGEIVDSSIVPAFSAGDFAVFESSVTRLGQIAFKAREVSAQSGAVKRLLLELAELPAIAAGMSSFGPVVYAVWEKDGDGADLLRMAARAYDVQMLDVRATPLGKGHVVYEQ
jgi:beta-ribofuranosylaminobenzene 5'-phosphate synthase